MSLVYSIVFVDEAIECALYSLDVQVILINSLVGYIFEFWPVEDGVCLDEIVLDSGN